MLPTHAFADFFPINYNIFSLPFAGIPNTGAAFDIYRQMAEEFPEILQEFTNAGLVPLGPYYSGRLDLYLTEDFEVRTPSNISGRRILVTGPYEAAILAASGAAPVITTMVDIFPQLSGGIAEGIITHSALVFSAGAHEITDSVVLFGERGAGPGIGKALFQFVMNPRTFNNLPEDLQALVRETFDKFSYELTSDEQRSHSHNIGVIEGLGANIIVLSDAEIAEFVRIAGDMHADNIAIAAARGINAQAIYDRLIELAAQHR